MRKCELMFSQGSTYMHSHYESEPFHSHKRLKVKSHCLFMVHKRSHVPFCWFLTLPIFILTVLKKSVSLLLCPESVIIASCNQLYWWLPKQHSEASIDVLGCWLDCKHESAQHNTTLKRFDSDFTASAGFSKLKVLCFTRSPKVVVYRPNVVNAGRIYTWQYAVWISRREKIYHCYFMYSRCLPSVCTGIECHFSLCKSGEWVGWKKKQTGVTAQTAPNFSVYIKTLSHVGSCSAWGHCTTWA